MSPNSSVIFERNYGTRHVATHRGEIMTAVSQPDWHSFVRAVGDLAYEGAGGFVTSPELITSADIELVDIPRQRSLIEDRIIDAKALSRQLPDSTLLLGSVAFDETVAKPRNAVLFLQNGSEVGRTYKKNPIGKAEREFLHDTAHPHEIVKPVPNILNIICSDLVTPPLIDAGVDTLLVSACWGTPAGYPGVVASPDYRHVEYIQQLTGSLFEQHSHLETIIMTDRAPTGNPSAEPFNFVATR